jgi:hypothetical protein
MIAASLYIVGGVSTVVRIRRNGTALYNLAPATGTYQIAFNLSDTPPSGSNVYTLTVSASTGQNISVTNRLLSLLGCKR